MIEKPKIFFDKDADVSLLSGKVIAVIGYGNQGRSQALNIRDNIQDADLKTKLIVGNVRDESYHTKKSEY
jgi:ketol-acid reductoisomerase